MRKKLFLGLACLTSISVATPAMALRTDRRYDVRFDGQIVGQWRLRNRVMEDGDICRYTVMWSNANATGAPLTRTRLCKIDETKASDNFDCEANRVSFFPTVIFNKADCACHGFDDFGQQTDVSLLVAGEDSNGNLNGIVMVSTIGDVQSLEVSPG